MRGELSEGVADGIDESAAEIGTVAADSLPSSLVDVVRSLVD